MRDNEPVKMVKPVCHTEGCDIISVKRGHCSSHYEKLRRAGHFPKRTVEQFYEERVDRSGGPDACHPWTRSTNQWGYGLFGHDGESLAARWAYKHFIGPLEPGEVVRHTCDNPPCQNRSHWVKGTQIQNIYDAVARNRQHRPIGEINVKARLTEEDVRAIRADRITPVVSQAERYGVCVATIVDVRNWKTWKHVA